MATSPRSKVTFEEWLHFPEDRTELLDGEVCEMPPATHWHQELVMRLLEIFRPHIRSVGRGFVSFDAGVRLAPHWGPRPDVVYSGEEPENPRYVDGPPDLAIEVVSDQWRDLEVKREKYEEFAVPEYWAVLPEAEQIQVYRLNERRYGRPAVFVPGDMLSSLALPGLEIDVTALFAR